MMVVRGIENRMERCAKAFGLEGIFYLDENPGADKDVLKFK